MCLEYYIKNCKGLCQGLQVESDYQENIKFVRQIIRGNFQNPLRTLRERMEESVRTLHFEEAQEIKKKIARLTNYQVRSTVINPSIDDVDVFTIISDEDYVYVNFLKVVQSAVLQVLYFRTAEKKLDESDEALLEITVVELRDRFRSTSKEIYLPMDLEMDLPGVKVTVPKIRDKRKIIEFSERHPRFYRQERLRQISLAEPDG